LSIENRKRGRADFNLESAGKEAVKTIGCIIGERPVEKFESKFCDGFAKDEADFSF
jgi:hypothetical protein